MDNSAGIQASLAGRYASALFDLASENGTVTAVESDLGQLETALAESSELAAVTTNPKVGRSDAQKALWGVSAILGVTELTQNFLGVLAQNRRLAELPKVIRAFRSIAAAQRGEVTAEVTSAHALTDTQLADLKARLSARGGLVVTIGSKRIDASIRTRLNSLSQAMKA